MIVKFAAWIMENDVEYEFPNGTPREEIEREFDSWIENNLRYTIEEVEEVENETDTKEDF